jgi:DNA-binding NtrC family response regulator
LLLDAARRRLQQELLRSSNGGCLRRELGDLHETVRAYFRPSLILGESEHARGLRSALERLCQTEEPVLLQGRDGSGTELAARVLHYASPRSGPCIALDCAAIHPSSLEQELFGGPAAPQPGRTDGQGPGLLVLSENGTLLLERVEHLSRELGDALARAVQAGVRARVVATCEAPLASRVDAGTFSGPLAALWANATLVFEPLVQRRDEIESLARALLARMGRSTVQFSDEVHWVFQHHDWPGDQAELREVLEHASLHADEGLIELAHLPRALQERYALQHQEHEIPALAPRERRPAARYAAQHNEGSNGSASSMALADRHQNGVELSLESYEKLAIQRSLEECRGNKLAAAKLLNLGKSTFYRKLKLHGL